MPPAPEAYVHRIGRTGRAGRGGTAITLAEPREHRLLRSIEQLTKQKIEVATVPTVTDLRARRLELTRASIRERLVGGDFDDVRVVVEALAEEFDLFDVAAAAVKLAHAAVAGEEEEQDIPAVEPAATRGARGSAGRERNAKRHSIDGHGVRLYIGAGRRAGIRPADLVGAITGEAVVLSRALGAIEIADRFSLVEVPDDLADDIIAAMQKSLLRGQKVIVRRDRERA